MAYRELNEAEMSWVRAGRMPCCGSETIIVGPGAGIMRNVTCPDCGTVLNLMDPLMGLPSFGEMIYEPRGYRQPVPMFGHTVKAKIQKYSWLPKWVRRLCR